MEILTMNTEQTEIEIKSLIHKIDTIKDEIVNDINVMENLENLNNYRVKLYRRIDNLNKKHLYSRVNCADFKVNLNRIK
jgi:SMC interacting uncharacterized protein involved in chromosome segregation